MICMITGPPRLFIFPGYNVRNKLAISEIYAGTNILSSIFMKARR
jgi:hypothetical protein